MTEECGNCKFSQLIWGPSAHWRLICRRFPPKQGDYPGVGKKDWCGEFKSKEPQDDQTLSKM